MRQNLVDLVSLSIVRRSAACAAPVMESASSSTIILKGGQGLPLDRFNKINLVNEITKKEKSILLGPDGADCPLRKRFDFFSDYLNSSFIGCIEL